MEIDRILSALPAERFDTLLGLEFKETGPDRVAAVLPITSRLHQAFGIVHGGVYAAAAETAASFGATIAAAGAALDEARERGDAPPGDPFGGVRVVGISNHTEFLRPVREGELRVEATPVTRGRTTQLWRVKITDDAGRAAAHSSVRLMNLRPEQ